MQTLLLLLAAGCGDEGNYKLCLVQYQSWRADVVDCGVCSFIWRPDALAVAVEGEASARYWTRRRNRRAGFMGRLRDGSLGSQWPGASW